MNDKVITQEELLFKLSLHLYFIFLFSSTANLDETIRLVYDIIGDLYQLLWLNSDVNLYLHQPFRDDLLHEWNFVFTFLEISKYSYMI